MTPWILAIDESGKVDDPNDPAIIGGVLLNARNTPALRAALRTSIDQALPGVAWPPHATDLNFPAMRATYAARGAPRASDAARAAAALLGLGSDAITDQDAARAHGASLRKHQPALFDRLEAEAKAGRSAMGSLVGFLPKASMMHGAFVVAAWEEHGPAGRNGGERYERLFNALAERVELLIEQSATEHQVETHAASYGGIDTFTLGDVARREGHGRPGNVKWFPFRPKRYSDVDIHPLVVLADHVCNRVRRALDAHWADVAERIHGDVGLSPTCRLRRGEHALPTIAAVGFPAEQIRRARAGESPLDLLPPLFLHDPPWAGEQAAAWIAALGTP